jgi:hypothetical protein
MNAKEYFLPLGIEDPSRFKDNTLFIRGFIDIDVYRKGVFVERICRRNVILNQGKSETIRSLSSGTSKVLARMAIGDRGALPSDPTVPKTPDATLTKLYSEVYRQDVDVTSVTTSGSTNEILLVTTFKAVDIPLSAYSDQTNPVVNEVGLIMIDQITGAPLPRPPVASPNLCDADETMFALRTYKSVPFEAANETAVTVRYTIFIG